MGLSKDFTRLCYVTLNRTKRYGKYAVSTLRITVKTLIFRQLI